MRRVVLDTNVIVSSLFGGKPRALLASWEARQFVLCLSSDILTEYVEVLQELRGKQVHVERLLRSLQRREDVLFVTPAPIARTSADPDDDMFLACALAAQADLIVSGDHHLLDLHCFRGIPIVLPAAALEVLNT